MTKHDLIEMLVNSGVEPNEAGAEIDMALEFALNKTKEELILEKNINYDKILPVIKERAETRRPIQYILGFAPFMGEKFIVNENVLIPRDETEILVRAVIHSAKNIEKKQIKILDIGTGSGIIACMAACHLGGRAQVLGVDISVGALGVAISNMQKLKLTGKVMFRKSDIFSNVAEQFDIIVSNPPYIPKKYAENIQKEVSFEPKAALFTDDLDGLYFYKKIISRCNKFLNPNGQILFEVMQNQAPGVCALLSENGFFDIKTIKDLAGIERVVCGTLKG